MRYLILLLIPLLILSCEKVVSPEPIEYGKDSCSFCRMIIADAGFSAELKTKKGKVYKFDSIECLAAFILSGKVKREEISALWVSDFYSRELVSVERVKFLVSEKIRSPMGLNISAYADEEKLKEAMRNFGGKVLNWEDVLSYVGEKWKERIGKGSF